jgi:alpha-amylase
MTSICCVFFLHHPCTLKKRTIFDAGITSVECCFDSFKDKQDFENFFSKRYIHFNNKLFDLIKNANGNFKVAFSISGITLEQMKLYAPEVVDSFQLLSSTGYVEFLSDTFYHSIAPAYDETEFSEQVQSQSVLVKELFGNVAKVICAENFVCVDALAKISGSEFVIILPDRVFLENFSEELNALSSKAKSQNHFSLNALLRKLVLKAKTKDITDINIVAADYHSFCKEGVDVEEIFNNMERVIAKAVSFKNTLFKMPSEVVETEKQSGELKGNYPPHSLENSKKSLSYRKLNSMQRLAFDSIMSLRNKVISLENENIKHAWRKFLTSDYFLYMENNGTYNQRTQGNQNPFNNAYDAFITYMNAFRSFESFLNSLCNENKQRNK